MFSQERDTERERETDRQTDTERERQRQRQTDRQRDRETETDLKKILNYITFYKLPSQSLGLADIFLREGVSAARHM